MAGIKSLSSLIGVSATFPGPSRFDEKKRKRAVASLRLNKWVLAVLAAYALLDAFLNIFSHLLRHIYSQRKVQTKGSEEGSEE